MEKTSWIRWVLFALNIFLLIAAAVFYSSIISYLVLGFIFAYLIAPVINYLEKYGISRSISILWLYLIIALLLYLLVEAIVPQLIQQYNDLKETFVQIFRNEGSINLKALGLEKFSRFLNNLDQKIPTLNINKTVYNIFNADKFNSLLNQIPAVFKGVFSLVAFAIVIPVISFFLLKDVRLIMNYIFSKIPNRYFEFSLHLFEKIEVSFGRFFRALLIETILVALMSSVGLLILRIPYALVLGIIVGIANPIKYFGPFIGAVPTLLVIIFTSTPDIYLVHSSLLFLVVQQIDGLILFPWLVGKSMDMHPLWVLLTVIAGGYGFGLLGMLLGVPVVFFIKLIVEVSHKSLKEFEII